MENEPSELFDPRHILTHCDEVINEYFDGYPLDALPFFHCRGGLIDHWCPYVMCEFVHWEVVDLPVEP